MKKIKLYSYTILLLISAFIVSPLIFKEIWESSKPQESSVSELTSEENDSDEPEIPQATTVPVQSNEISTTVSMPIEPTITTTTTEPPPIFVQGDASYFDDALFVGDSRTVGLSEYGTLKNADYFCDTGMSVYSLGKTKDSIEGLGNVNFDTLLSSKQYSKVYLMLGINELGSNFETSMKKYSEWVDFIRTKQPDALIFIQGNLHVSKARSDSDNVYNNAAINKFNENIAKLADNNTIFYIDVNELFDDEHGNLPQEYTSDNTHVYAKHYSEWCDWLCTKTVIKSSTPSDASTETTTV